MDIHSGNIFDSIKNPKILSERFANLFNRCSRIEILELNMSVHKEKSLKIMKNALRGVEIGTLTFLELPAINCAE